VVYAEAMRELLDPARFPALAPMIAAGEFDDGEDDLDDIFEFGIARVLDGLEALITSRKPGRRRRAR